MSNMASQAMDTNLKDGIKTEVAEMKEEKISTSDRVSFKPCNYHIMVPVSTLSSHLALDLVSRLDVVYVAAIDSILAYVRVQ